MNTNSQGQNPLEHSSATRPPLWVRVSVDTVTRDVGKVRARAGDKVLPGLKALRCVSDAREACGFPSWCCCPQGVQPKTNTVLENAPPRAPGTAPGRAVGTKCAARSDLTRVSATTAPEGFRRVSTVTALLARGQEAGGAQGRF